MKVRRSKQLLAKGSPRAPSRSSCDATASCSVLCTPDCNSLMLGMKNYICFPVIHCPVEVGYEGVISMITTTLKATVP